MIKRIAKALFIVLLGIIGGIFGAQIIWPLFVERPLFPQFNLEQAPTYVNQINQITVQENTALLQSVDKVKRSIISIRATTPAGAIIKSSAFVLTSDGLAIALNDSLPQGSDFSFIFDGEKLNYQILKRNPKNNLVLIKLDKNGLSTESFLDAGQIKTGQRIFAVGLRISIQENAFSSSLLVNEGIVRNIGYSSIETSMIDNSELRGAPVFDIEGNVVGLADVDYDGRVIVLPSTVIRQFAGL